MAVPGCDSQVIHELSIDWSRIVLTLSCFLRAAKYQIVVGRFLCSWAVQFCMLWFWSSFWHSFHRSMKSSGKQLLRLSTKRQQSLMVCEAYDCESSEDVSFSEATEPCLHIQVADTSCKWCRPLHEPEIFELNRDNATGWRRPRWRFVETNFHQRWGKSRQGLRDDLGIVVLLSSFFVPSFYLSHFFVSLTLVFSSSRVVSWLTHTRGHESTFENGSC